MRRLVGVVVVVSACSFEHGSLSTDAGSTDSDAMMPDTPPLGAWGTVIDVGISSGAGDDDPSLTDDMLELYFGSRRIPGGSGSGDENIYVVKRATMNDAWSLPATVDELNTTSADTTVKVSGDGLMLFLTSDRNGNADVYTTTRASRNDPWGTPVRVSELSTGVGDWAAFVQRSKKHLVLCSGANAAGEALYVSNRPTALEPWGPPQRLVELDEPNVSEGDPWEPNSDSTVMYYSSQRLNTDNTYDIYRVDRPRATDSWGNRTKVEGISTDGHHDRDPWVSADERTMYFSSTRDGSGVDKIYMSTR